MRLAGLMLAGIFCGQVSAQSAPLPAPEHNIKDIDRVHQGDIIDVDVVGSFEFDWRGGLNPEGFIDGIERIPEPIYARCKATSEIAKAIAEGYRRVLRDPVVVVRILDRNGRALAYVDGAVKTPLKLRIRRDVNLNELIVVAGGFTDVVGNEIGLFRPEGASCEGVGAGQIQSGPNSRIIKIDDLLSGDAESNAKILPGDIVTVVKSMPIYVIGGVVNPQRISARTGTTLSRAIDTAGGVAKNGRGDTVTIYRRGSGIAKVIQIDLAKIRAGEAVDPALEANDIVEVPLKGDPKRRFPPVVDIRESDTRQMPIRIIE